MGIIEERIEAWLAAKELIAPIIIEHGLEEYRSGPVFGHISTVTKIDQHIDHVTHLANWLIGLDN